MILSNVLIYKEKAGDTQGTSLLKKVSPVAWQHINLYGRYEFSGSLETIDINAITQKLSQVPLS